MGLFDKIREPIFLKEDSSLKKQLEELEHFYQKADAKLKPQIEKDMIAIRAGIAGEDNIKYELRNSHMPMYVIQDFTITHNDLKSQIDFVVVTRGLVFIIECKNLYGDITVDNKGQFIRKMNYGSYSRKESIYSPIEQNRKHLELIKQ